MNYCSCSKLTKLYKIVDKRKFADYNEIVVRTKVFRVNSERLFFCFILLKRILKRGVFTMSKYTKEEILKSAQENGNPYPFGFSAPQEVILDMLSNVRTSQGYSDSKGIFSARKAIMQYAQLRGIPGVTINDIYTGNGVSELINLCMQALLDNGDEILIPAPDYPLWTATATLAGGNVVHYICDEQSDWYPDIEDIKSKITPRTKAIVIINPNNPTGAVYPKEILEQIADIAREHELIIFSDKYH